MSAYKEATPRKVIGNSEREGVSKAKILKESRSLTQNSREVGGSNHYLPWGGGGFKIYFRSVNPVNIPQYTGKWLLLHPAYYILY